MDEKRLTRAWLMLLALTAGTAVAGRVTATENGLALVWLVALGLVSMLKARMILMDYLDLKGARDWAAGFTAALVFLVAIVYGLSAIAWAGARPQASESAVCTRSPTACGSVSASAAVWPSGLIFAQVLRTIPTSWSRSRPAAKSSA